MVTFRMAPYWGCRVISGIAYNKIASNMEIDGCSCKDDPISMPTSRGILIAMFDSERVAVVES